MEYRLPDRLLDRPVDGMVDAASHHGSICYLRHKVRFYVTYIMQLEALPVTCIWYLVCRLAASSEAACVVFAACDRDGLRLRLAPVRGPDSETKGKQAWRKCR